MLTRDAFHTVLFVGKARVWQGNDEEEEEEEEGEIFSRVISGMEYVNVIVKNTLFDNGLGNKG